MTPMWFDSAKLALWTGGMNLATDPLWVALVTDAYKPDASHTTLANITGEVVADGYTTGGQPITGQSVIVNAAQHRVEFHADPSSWKSPSITATGFVIYKKGDTPATSPLIAVLLTGNMTQTYTLTCDPAKGYLAT